MLYKMEPVLDQKERQNKELEVQMGYDYKKNASACLQMNLIALRQSKGRLFSTVNEITSALFLQRFKGERRVLLFRDFPPSTPYKTRANCS